MSALPIPASITSPFAPGDLGTVPATLALFIALGVAACPAVAQSPWLLVSGDGNGGQVIRYHGDSGDPFDHFVGDGIGSLDGPVRMARGPDGALYVSSYYTDAILRYDAHSGAYLGEFIAPGLGGLDGPWDLLFHEGTLYVASALNDRVLTFDAGSGAFLATTITTGSGGLDGPSDLALRGGLLYVTSNANARVLRYTTAGVFLDVFIEPGHGLNSPRGLVFLEAGDALLASRNSDQILRYDADGDFLGVFTGGLGSPLEGPNDMMLGPDGLLYVVSSDNNRVIRYDVSTGAPQEGEVFVSSGSGSLDFGRGLAFVEPLCKPDLNEDGTVDGADLGLLLGSFGGCTPR